MVLSFVLEAQEGHTVDWNTGQISMQDFAWIFFNVNYATKCSHESHNIKVQYLLGTFF